LIDIHLHNGIVYF